MLFIFIFMLFIFIFMFSFFLSLSSNSWFFLWCSFEINMLTFISLNKKMSSSMNNSLLKYFIFQSMSSSLFLFSLFLNTSKISQMNMIQMLIIISMWMKLGFFPFNSWYFQMSENMNWNIWFILNTFQKIMPIWILSFNLFNLKMILTMLMMNITYSFLEMWNQSSFRWMINSSSLNHYSWMIMSFNSNHTIWEFYFIMYLMMSYMLYNFLKYNNWNTIINSINNKSILMNMIMSLLMFNFMGMPPFLGFIPKMIILKMNLYFWPLLILLVSNIFMCIIYFNFIITLTKKTMMKTYKKNFETFIMHLMFLFLFLNIIPIYI